MSNDIMTVTVGYDGTGSSAEAVRWAADEASTRGAPLRIVSCFEMPVLSGDPTGGWGVGDLIEALRSAAVANVDRIEATVAASHPELLLATEVSLGPASSAILSGVTLHDLVVVGASGHEGVSAFWLGSTPRHLVRSSPCPVAVIRGAASRGRPDRVVVGVDGSAGATQALRWAGDEADRHRTELVIVHAWSYAYSSSEHESVTARELTQIDAACTLEGAAESAREQFGVVVTPILLETSAVSALLDTVRDGDLLVVGSRGRGAWRSGLFGSTVNSVLDVSAVPVIVVGAELVDEEAHQDRDRSVEVVGVLT